MVAASRQGPRATTTGVAQLAAAGRAGANNSSRGAGTRAPATGRDTGSVTGKMPAAAERPSGQRVHRFLDAPAKVVQPSQVREVRSEDRHRSL